MTRLLRRCVIALCVFRRNDGGVVAIEFAMVGLPFLLLIVAIMVVGFLLYAQSTLDYATQKAARQVMVGTVQTSSLTADQFRTTILCPLLPATFTCSNVIVSLQSVASTTPNIWYNYVTTSGAWYNVTGLLLPTLSNSQTSFCSGGAGQYKLLEVFYPMPIYLSIFATSAQVVTYNGSNAYLLTSTAVFKNELTN